ncbi:MAG: hypothetical protein RLZZ337_783 [Bacteroidota bacterium]|jgi:N-acetylneuraminic acid mutarotase
MLSGFYKYDPATDLWSSLISNSSNITLRTGAEAVVLNNSVYLIVGLYGNGVHTSLHQLVGPDSSTVYDTIYIHTSILAIIT